MTPERRTRRLNSWAPLLKLAAVVTVLFLTAAAVGYLS